MKFYIAVVSFLTEVPVLSQAFLRSASTQYRRVPAHFKPCWPLDTRQSGQCLGDSNTQLRMRYVTSRGVNDLLTFNRSITASQQCPARVPLSDVFSVASCITLTLSLSSRLPLFLSLCVMSRWPSVTGHRPSITPLRPPTQYTSFSRCLPGLTSLTPPLPLPWLNPGRVPFTLNWVSHSQPHKSVQCWDIHPHPRMFF